MGGKLSCGSLTFATIHQGGMAYFNISLPKRWAISASNGAFCMFLLTIKNRMPEGLAAFVWALNETAQQFWMLLLC